ncbi:hypothetical protein DL768_004381 [Monosporascus sp. mg162]|nr:hypothetical protein DL768_004381 [Monosporascus sp. mg162]
MAPEEIPQSPISILRDVVSLRKQSARFFSRVAEKSNDEKLKESNATHEFIIKVLEKILAMFDAALATISRKDGISTKQPDGQIDVNDLNNMFEYLEVEQSQELDEQDTDGVPENEKAVPKRSKRPQKKNGKKQNKKKPPKERRVQKETQDNSESSWVEEFQWDNLDSEGEDDLDYYMIIYCFFQDFNAIRNYVGDRWWEYFYFKSVSIDNLAVMTNAAYEMFHEMEFELEKALKDVHPEMAHYEFMMETLFFDYGLDHVDYEDEDELTEEERSDKIFKEADWLGVTVYALVEDILAGVPPGKVPMIPLSELKKPEYGPHTVDSIRHFFGAIIFELFPECCLMKAMKKNGQLPFVVGAQDEMTLNFEHIFRVRDYPSAFIFSLALYVDIRYILEDQVRDAYDQLQITGAMTKAKLEEHLPSLKGPMALRKECTARIAELHYCVINDFTEEDRRRRFMEKGVTEPFEKHFHLKRNPVWSAFVYYAARMGKCGAVWPMMDRFLHAHGVERVLQGAVSADDTPLGLLKRFVECGLATTPAGDLVGFSRRSISLEAFTQRYGFDDGNSRRSMSYLREIIREKFDVQAGNIFSRQAAIAAAQKDGGEHSSQTLAPLNGSSPDQSVVQKIRKEALQSSRVSPVDLLEILDETTTGLLENQLTVEYFQLHDESVRLFRDLLKEFSPEADKDTSFAFDENSRGWCHWGENITLRYKGKPVLEHDIHLGDTWKIGEGVRLQVCGSRIPCEKVSWRCGQKTQWLQPLAASGRVGVYLRVLTGGRVHPGDEVVCEYASDDNVDVATVTQVAYDTSLKTRDTLDVLANHKLLLEMNRFLLRRKLTSMDDKLNQGKNAWKGWRGLRVDRVVEEGGDVKSFYFQADDGQPLANYLPGQFLSVRLPDGKIRSWTISDWPARTDPPYYRISIKLAGQSSSWMHSKCTPGTVLQVRSPAGRFVLDWTQKYSPRQIYVSAGIGITPVLAMMKAHDCHPNYRQVPALWIHVAKNSAALPFRDEVPLFEGRPFRRMHFFTDPLPSDVLGVDYDFAGRPDPEALREILAESYTWKPLGSRDYTMEGHMSFAYVCGPPAFEAAMRACLLPGGGVGLPPPFVHSESFSGSGAAVAGAGDVKRAIVRFERSGKQAAWVHEEPLSLLELAEAAGLTPDYGCRVGACGSCAARLVCGSVSGGLQLDGTVLTCSATPASEVVEIDI